MNRSWVLNSNAYKRRGVWHCSKDDVPITHHEALVKRKVVPIFKYHANICHGGVYGGGNVERCQCELETQEPRLQVGSYTKVVNVPAYDTIGRVWVLCNQVVINGSGELTWEKYIYNPKDGMTYEQTLRAIKPNVWVVDEPVGPTCIRCLRKAEERDAAVTQSEQA